MAVHRTCDGVSRRDVIKVGALGFLGLGAEGLCRLQAAHGAEAASARSVILLWMDGGPPQHETFDPKPDAPSDMRGEFGAIPSNLDGVLVSDLMPKMAKRMNMVTLVRTMQHNEGAHERARSEERRVGK